MDCLKCFANMTRSNWSPLPFDMPHLTGVAGTSFRRLPNLEKPVALTKRAVNGGGSRV